MTDETIEEKIWENRLTLDKALEAGVPKLKCFVYKITVGGKEYIGFTSQKPEKRMEQHLESAKNESFQKLHKELRRFGYLHEFEVISEHENEVMGLVAEISNIQKYKPELNVSIGGEGNSYDVIEGKNHLGENVFYVEDKKLEKRILKHERKKEKKLNYYITLIKKINTRDRDRFEERLSKIKKETSLSNIYKIYEFEKANMPITTTTPIKSSYVGAGTECDKEVLKKFLGLSYNESELKRCSGNDENFNKIWKIKVKKEVGEIHIRQSIFRAFLIIKRENLNFSKWYKRNSKFFKFLSNYSCPINDPYSIKLLLPSSFYFDYYRDTPVHPSKLYYNIDTFKETFNGLNDSENARGWTIYSRIFYINEFETKSFRNIHEAKVYIKKQNMFKEGIKEKIFKPSDAFYPIKIKSFFSSKDEYIKFSDLMS